MSVENFFGDDLRSDAEIVGRLNERKFEVQTRFPWRVGDFPKGGDDPNLTCRNGEHAGEKGDAADED